MRGKGLAVIAGALVLSACSVFGGPSAPEPDYRVVRAEGPFEVRSYPPLAIASTPMGGSFDENTSPAFQRLFDYISGANTGGQDIAMTAPVIRQPTPGEESGKEIAMTAPVIRQPAGDGWEMIFVLPEGMTAETAPEPTDDAVSIGTIPGRRVAAVRFSGLVDEGDIETQLGRLLEWVEDQGLTPAGQPEVAGYDPPWTLPWFRRNEVIVPLAAARGG